MGGGGGHISFRGAEQEREAVRNNGWDGKEKRRRETAKMKIEEEERNGG